MKKPTKKAPKKMPKKMPKERASLFTRRPKSNKA